MRGSQYLSVKYTGRLAVEGIEPPGGSVGEPYEDVLAEKINGLVEADVVHRRGLWRSFVAVEYPTPERMDWTCFGNKERVSSKLRPRSQVHVEARGKGRCLTVMFSPPIRRPHTNVGWMSTANLITSPVSIRRNLISTDATS